MTADPRRSTTTDGQTPDTAGGAHPRVDTRLAWLRTRLSVERTMMAWNRTSLALIGFGFTIYQFFTKLQEATGAGVIRTHAPRNLGVALMLVGTLGTLVALWQYYLFVKYLNGPEFEEIAIEEGMPHWSLPVAVTVFLAVIGIVTTGGVMLRG